MVWFFTAPRTREEARQKFYEASRGHRDHEVARAIERRISVFSPDHGWAKEVRRSYRQYARFLTDSERNLQQSQRLALLDPDAGRRLAL